MPSNQEIYFEYLVDYLSATKQNTLAKGKEEGGVSQGTISHIKQGIKVRPSTIKKTAQSLEIPQSEFLSASGYNPKFDDMREDLRDYGRLTLRPEGSVIPFNEEFYLRSYLEVYPEDSNALKRLNEISATPNFSNSSPDSNDSDGDRKYVLASKKASEGGITGHRSRGLQQVKSGPKGENLQTGRRRFDLLVQAEHWHPLLVGEWYTAFRWDETRVRPGNVILQQQGDEYLASIYEEGMDTQGFSSEVTFVVINQTLPPEEDD